MALAELTAIAGGIAAEILWPLVVGAAKMPAGARETARQHGIDPSAPGERYQVVVHVDAGVLADPDEPGQSVLEDGPRVPAGTSQRLGCDASLVVMRHGGDGRVVEVA